MYVCICMMVVDVYVCSKCMYVCSCHYFLRKLLRQSSKKSVRLLAWCEEVKKWEFRVFTIHAYIRCVKAMLLNRSIIHSNSIYESTEQHSTRMHIHTHTHYKVLQQYLRKYKSKYVYVQYTFTHTQPSTPLPPSPPSLPPSPRE